MVWIFYVWNFCWSCNYRLKLLTRDSSPWRQLMCVTAEIPQDVQNTFRFLFKLEAWKAPQNLPAELWESWNSVALQLHVWPWHLCTSIDVSGRLSVFVTFVFLVKEEAGSTWQLGDATATWLRAKHEAHVSQMGFRSATCFSWLCCWLWRENLCHPSAVNVMIIWAISAPSLHAWAMCINSFFVNKSLLPPPMPS